MNYSRPAINQIRFAGRLFLCGVLVVFPMLLRGGEIAHAAKMPHRSLAIGDSRASAVTRYTFSWQYPTSAVLGSIRLILCTDPFYEDACTPPNGGDFSNAILAGQQTETGFTILSKTTNEIVLTRSPAATTTLTDAKYDLDTITNQSDIGTFYVRVWTYSSNNGTGLENEVNSVVNSTTEGIGINTEVPPILIFCVGLVVDDICNTSTGNFIDYGTLTSLSAAYGTSQFAVATNADNGYSISVYGHTMTAGNKTIAPLIAPAFNTPGSPQFGLNMRANSSPPDGADISGIGIGAVAVAYDLPDSYQFNSGDVVATATTGTNFNKYTQTYIVNVPADQPSGIYNTTVTYICTGSF